MWTTSPVSTSTFTVLWYVSSPHPLGLRSFCQTKLRIAFNESLRHLHLTFYCCKEETKFGSGVVNKHLTFFAKTHNELTKEFQKLTRKNMEEQLIKWWSNTSLTLNVAMLKNNFHPKHSNFVPWLPFLRNLINTTCCKNRQHNDEKVLLTFETGLCNDQKQLYRNHFVNFKKLELNHLKWKINLATKHLCFKEQFKQHHKKTPKRNTFTKDLTALPQSENFLIIKNAQKREGSQAVVIATQKSLELKTRNSLVGEKPKQHHHESQSLKL